MNGIYRVIYMGDSIPFLGVKIPYKSFEISLNRKPPIGGNYSKDYIGDLYISGILLYNILLCCY